MQPPARRDAGFRQEKFGRTNFNNGVTAQRSLLGGRLLVGCFVIVPIRLVYQDPLISACSKLPVIPNVG